MLDRHLFLINTLNFCCCLPSKDKIKGVLFLFWVAIFNKCLSQMFARYFVNNINIVRTFAKCFHILINCSLQTFYNCDLRGKYKG